MSSSEVLILASSSPRRRELLGRLGLAFEVVAPGVEEPRTSPAALSPRGWAEALAYLKARSVADARPGRWVLGADTLVEVAGELLGKPDGEADARRMLELQAAHPSDVITGIALVRREQAWLRRIASASTRVWMRDDAGERERYLRSGDWAGKAGAYGVQDVGDRLVERIEGSISNVIGLPLERLAQLLRLVRLLPAASDESSDAAAGLPRR